MKIGLARRGYSPTGGAEAYLTRFAHALTLAGHEAMLLGTAAWPDDEWPGTRGPVLTGTSPRSFADAVERTRAFRVCDYLFSMERVWRCDAYRAGDGVHRAWLERRKAAEPFWKRWGRVLNRKHAELLRLEEKLFSPEGAGFVIANSRMVKEEIVRYYGYPEERIRVIYNGLPARRRLVGSDVRAARRAQLGATEEECLILFAGSGWARKGLRQAVEAVRQARFGRKARLIVAGKGNRSSLPRSERVHFAGPLGGGRMAAYYTACDLFVLPTLYDPFSNASLEALVAGLPVITTAANGFSEVLRPGEEGEVLADPLDVAALARALEAWNDPARIAEARPRLQARAGEFSIRVNVAETLAALGLAGEEGPGKEA